MGLPPGNTHKVSLLPVSHQQKLYKVVQEMEANYHINAAFPMSGNA